MLLKDKTTVKFNKQWPKILFASSAFNNTFVFVRMDKPGTEESIVHVDASGKQIWSRKYNDIIDFFGMMNQKQVIVLNVPESKIDIINLQTQKIMQINNKYSFDDTASMEIATFSETKFFVIMERGGLNDNRFILTYYDYNGIKQDSQPIARWEAKDNEWTYEHTHAKVNNHSKVAIWKYQHDQQLVFTYVDLKKNIKGALHTVKAKINIGAQYGVGDIQLKISYLWEMRPNVYMIAALSNKSDHKDKCKDKNGIYNNNYVVDASMGDENATIRQAKFTFKVEPDGFCYNDQLTDCFGLGNVSVFHTFRHKDGQVQKTPIYYVQNQTEEIVATEEWESSCYADNFFFPGWDGSTVVQAYHTNGDCEECTITVKKLVDPREISMYFMLHLNQDFDDDMLQDAIELLH